MVVNVIYVGAPISESSCGSFCGSSGRCSRPNGIVSYMFNKYKSMFHFFLYDLKYIYHFLLVLQGGLNNFQIHGAPSPSVWHTSAPAPSSTHVPQTVCNKTC